MTIRIEYMPLSDLLERFHPDNPKSHDVGAISVSIDKLEYRMPVMIDERSGYLAAGHGRVKALASMQQQQMPMPLGVTLENGNWLVPVVRGSEYTPEQLQAYIVADNNLTMAGGWHDEQLAELLQDLAATDTALMEATGWDGDSLDELLRDLGMGQEPTPDPGAQVDRAAELQEVWQVKRGQVWEVESKTGNGSHRILCGDSTCEEDVGRLMDGEKADAVVTDPPYGMNWNADASRFSGGKFGNHPRGREREDVIGDDVPFNPVPYLGYPIIVLWGMNHFCDRLPPGGVFVWLKKPDDRFGTFLSDCELAWTNCGRGVYAIRHEWGGITRESERGEYLHPTQKPVAVVAWTIEKTKAMGVIFDPFLGSGTTIVACEQIGRIGRGMEIEPKYVAITLQRLSDMGLTPRLTI